jgi:glycosyltransferase involved in cell wall biosynthesis
MDNKPTISIIVPVYNTEKYLRRCLDSIVAQTFKDYECIIVDDGSTDGSAAICDEYEKKDSRFKVLHKENEGVSAARNVGIEYAEGEFITFVDSDDYLSSVYLRDLYDNKEYDYVVGSFQTFPALSR